ncbi:hypothetical protein EV363DRAFT_1453447 [Boletus edulis]|nr:hypothetical protein EV363DRAFT_1453447 [Boletus edulis]
MTSSTPQNPTVVPNPTASSHILPSIIVTPTSSVVATDGSGSAPISPTPSPSSTIILSNLAPITSPISSTLSTPVTVITSTLASSGSSISKAQQWLATYTLLSPDSKAQAAQAFEAIKQADVVTVLSPSVLFSANKEHLLYGLGIHSSISELAKVGQYLPLILFTDDIIKHLHRGGLTLKKVKTIIAGITHHLLDLLDPKVADPNIHERWNTHYDLLSKDEAIHSNFKAILMFDINWRASYATQPFTHGLVQWLLHLQVTLSYLFIALSYIRLFQSTKSEIATERLAQLSSCEDRFSSSLHYEPYNTACKNARRPCDAHDQSFRDHPSESKPKSDPTCLICGRNGHHIAECQEETTMKGKQMFAKFADKQLIHRSNDSPIYIIFNLNITQKPCKQSHGSTQHVCSLCRDSAHAALSRLCI